jgi:hypothetical protein
MDYRHTIKRFFREENPLVDVLLSLEFCEGHDVPILGFVSQLNGQRNRLQHAAVFFERLQEANVGRIRLNDSQFRYLSDQYIYALIAENGK